MQPTLTHIACIKVQVGEMMTVDQTREGIRRAIPILGGRIDGTRLSGSVLPGGADHQMVRPDDYLTLEARYILSMDDGALIYVVNRGVRFGPPDVIARINRGEIVDPSLVYFRTTPRFETASPDYQWLTRPLFVATGARYPDRVEINVFEVG